MKIKIERLNIEDNPANEVTSHKLFKSHKAVKNGKFEFHEDGIFSKRIFGQYGHCDCLTNPRTEPGICKECGVRVLSRSKTPDYYISFKGIIDIPFVDIDYSVCGKYKKEVEKLMHYQGFLYKGKYKDFKTNQIVLIDEETKLPYDDADILFGKDAVLALGISEEWYDAQVTDKIYIPHPSFRKITTVGTKHYIGPLNNALLNLLKMKKSLIAYSSYSEIEMKMAAFGIKRELVETVNLVYTEMFNMLAARKKSIIAKEVRGQCLTGAIRGVLTNNFGLDEDTIIIGKYFIKTLYPELYSKYAEKIIDPQTKKETLGEMDTMGIEALNKELEEKAYYVLVNRPPTIGEKSIMAFKPVFSTVEAEQYVIQMNPISFDGFAADTDGDCVMVCALYTVAANKEAELLLPSRNYIGGADGSIRNGLPEDFTYVFQKAYQDNEAESIHAIIEGGSN